MLNFCSAQGYCNSTYNSMCVVCFHAGLKIKSLQVKLLNMLWQTNRTFLMCILVGLTSVVVHCVSRNTLARGMSLIMVHQSISDLRIVPRLQFVCLKHEFINNKCRE